MDAAHIGRRIAYWRDQRGLTQADLGRLMGQSRRWVQDLEGGHRQTDPRLSVLQRAAHALRIPLERLVADTPQPSLDRRLPAEVSALIDSLHASAPAGQPVPLSALHRRVTYCCQAWEACHYAAAARELPGVLADAHCVVATGPSAAILLSRAYQLTASLLFKYGEPARTPAVLAADRALAAAQTSGDVVAIGAASRRVARGLIHQQRHTAAAAYATATAETLRPDLEASGAPGMSTLGMLYLVAAVAVTGDGRSPRTVGAAADRLAAASDVATRQGEQGADFTSFGATNVALHQVDVALRLDDAWSAVEASVAITPEAINTLGRERQARHLVTTARARALTRDRDAATRDLLHAERLAPEEVRRPSVARLVAELLELVPTPGTELTGLARRCGLPA
ncbi:helix-turn-helix transcriptional regulator [Streptomyces sp. CAI-21]|uniref:helix-turn-helix domain-containing protein n=1 Tax=Streptomyces TaxID=1883 RepID=UPI001587EF38|nr:MULTISPECIES: helix-turn-helix transcriptional regulator [Streptomyces]MCO6695333.1 helix-turn-helix domain-containing protein [Streptomyces sp. Vc17.3-30]NUW06745.1 helix-turn-helix transcriptional regulator [Streptomyces sp. CAI-21]